MSFPKHLQYLLEYEIIRELYFCPKIWDGQKKLEVESLVRLSLEIRGGESRETVP